MTRPGDRLTRLSRLACGCFALLAIAAPAAFADEAAPIYDPTTVDVIELTLSPEAEAALEVEPDEYVCGGFRLAETSGVPGSEKAFSPLLNVGIRLKGTGSFQNLGGKSAFKIKFGECVAKQKFLGLKKLTLNNMVQDPSMLHETLAYSLFRAAGVPAPRTGFADVRVNDVEYGLHLDLETLDDVALKRIFGAFKEPPQHLYEADQPGVDVEPGRAGEFEVDEGEEADISDLEALVEAVNSTGPESWSERVAATVDLQEMTRDWAVEKYIGDWDGYAGVDDIFRPNNYYLYSDLEGRFQMLPTGADQTWEKRIDFDEPDGVMFNLCLEDPACKALFEASLKAVLAALDEAQIDPLAAQTAALLEPWQELEVEPRRPFDGEEIAEGVAETRQFAATRTAEALAWLPPGPPAPQPPAAVTPPPAPGPLGQLLSGMRVRRAGADLKTTLDVAVAGQLSQRVTLATRSGTIEACHSAAAPIEAGERTIHCHLSDAVRERLRTRWLRLTVATRIAPASGAPQTLTRRVTLRRG